MCNFLLPHFLINKNTRHMLYKTGLHSYCPAAKKYGSGPPKNCRVYDPNQKPKSTIENWFTKEMFYVSNVSALAIDHDLQFLQYFFSFQDLFPKANLGWGPHKCLPYSYEAFVIAARYFPDFGTTYPEEEMKEVHTRRDVAAFFAHAVQETGENNAHLYKLGLNKFLLVKHLMKRVFKDIWLLSFRFLFLIWKNSFIVHQKTSSKSGSSFCTAVLTSCFSRSPISR